MRMLSSSGRKQSARNLGQSPKRTPRVDAGQCRNVRAVRSETRSRTHADGGPECRREVRPEQVNSRLPRPARREVIAFLSNPETHGGAPVERVDTHISRDFLAGTGPGS